MSVVMRAGNLPGTMLLAFGLAVAACSPEPVAGPDERPELARGGGSGTVTVSAADPDTVPIDTTLTVRILGSGFTAGSRVDYAIAGTVSSKVTATNVIYVNSSELRTTTVVAADAPLAFYDVMVTTLQGKRGIGVEKLLVQAKLVFLPEPGGVGSEAYDINDAGVIVGSMRDASDQFWAMKWSPVGEQWSAQVLGPGAARGINAAGDILLGDRVRLASGVEVSLGTDAYLIGLSDDGTVIGSVGDASSPALWRRTGPASWSPPIMLSPVAGYQAIWLNAISGNGLWIAGGVHTISEPSREWATAWNRVGDTWTGPLLVDAGMSGAALAVNSAGAFGGASWPCTDATCTSLPAYWPSIGGPRTILQPTSSSGLWSPGRVRSMNDFGVIAGYAMLRINARKGGTYSQRPVLWYQPSAPPFDLGTGNSGRAGEVLAINGTGKAAGFVYANSQNHAVVWVLP